MNLIYDAYNCCHLMTIPNKENVIRLVVFNFATLSSGLFVFFILLIVIFLYEKFHVYIK